MSYGDFHGPLDDLLDTYKRETSGGGTAASAITAEIQKWKDLAAIQAKRLTDAQAELLRLRAEAQAFALDAGQQILNMRDPSSLLEWIKVESAYGPTLELQGPFGPSKTSAEPSILARVKPKITLKFKPITQPIIIQPYGAPGATLWPYLLFGVGALVGAAGGGVVLGRIGAVGGAVLAGTALTHFGSVK